MKKRFYVILAFMLCMTSAFAGKGIIDIDLANDSNKVIKITDKSIVVGDDEIKFEDIKEDLGPLIEKFGSVMESVNEGLDNPNTTTITKNIDDGMKIAKRVVSMILLGIILSILTPIGIVFICLYFVHRNRKAKYQLMEKMAENGQQIPDDMLHKVGIQKDLWQKGVKNIGIGIVWFIFLWAFTDKLFIGCIGLFFVANGVSQYLSAKREEKLAQHIGNNQAPTDEAYNNQPTQPTVA